MAKEQGSLSISSENIFPVIKKWLYSDHDIFIRELVSNGCDAITKLKKLALMGEATIADDNKFKILVEVDVEEKTITFFRQTPTPRWPSIPRHRPRPPKDSGRCPPSGHP